MGKRLEKIEEISAQLKDKYQQIRELQDQLAQLNQDAHALENEKIKNTILGNIEDGILPTSISNEEVEDDEELEDDKKYYENINKLYFLGGIHHQYGEEYILPMGEYGFVPEDDWDGWETVLSGIVINVNGTYIVNGEYKFDTIDELLEWAKGRYPEFMSDEKNVIKLKTLNNISIQQLEDMFDGKDIEKENLSKRERFEQALLRDDVVDYFLEKSPEELAAFFGPDVARMVGFEQNNPHHCYDLFEHILNTVEGIDTEGLSQEDAIKLKVAAFFHDIGKPEVAMVKGDKTVFYNHAKKSAETSRAVLGALGYEPKEIAQIQFYIEHHDDFINFKREDEDWNRKNRFLRGISLETVARKIQETKEDIAINRGYNPTKKDYQLLLKLCKADANAQSRIVREFGRITDSRANKVSRLSQVEELVPQAYDLSIEMTADKVKNIGQVYGQQVGDAIDKKVRNERSIFGTPIPSPVSINVDDDIREYYEAIKEAYMQDGEIKGIPTSLKSELQKKGMTGEQYRRSLELLGKDIANKVIVGVDEIHKAGRLTELFDVKKVLIERNRDAEALLQQYEERLRREGISKDK